MRPKEIFEQRTSTGVSREFPWRDAGQSVREQIHYVCETRELSRHQKEMSFLRHLMLYDDTPQGQCLEEKLAGVERNERCCRRAVWCAALLTGLALAGLGYSAIFFLDFPVDRARLLTRLFCALGIASLVSLLTFAALWLVSRMKLEDQRDECRRLVTRIVEFRLGKPLAVSSAKTND
jgi:hypothetical protein